MRFVGRGATLLLLLLSSVLHARADLVVIQQVEGTGQKGTMTMKVKGTKARTDLSPEVSTITDGATGDVVTLMHQAKTFMRIPAASANELRERLQLGQVRGAAPPATPPKLQPLGKKQKISGYDTELFAFELGTIKAKYWVAKTFPNYAAVLEQMDGAQSNGIASMMKGMTPGAGSFAGMPMKTEVEMKHPGSSEVQKITTTISSVQQQTVKDSEFDVPADYREAPAPKLDFPSGPHSAP